MTRWKETGETDWIDGHVHILDGGIKETEKLVGAQQDFGYTHSAFLSVEGMDDAAQNALAIYFKLLSPNNYAFGGLHYRFAYDFGREAERLWRIGLDGMKMIENKPTERKRLGYAQNDGRYDGFYAALERLQMPLLVHVADPADFWDGNRIPDWARDSGYFYGDGGYPSYEQLIREALEAVEKHPGLKVCFAHFMFLSDNYDRLCDIMERYPNLRLDLTAGTEMYFAFTKNPEKWRGFFLKYQNRIQYGTDNFNAATEEEACNMAVVNRMEKEFLCSGERFPVWDKEVQGLGLPWETVHKLTAENFRQFARPKPRELNRKEAAVYLYERLTTSAFRLTEREKNIIWEVYNNCV